jgi:hypothetical protein
MVIVLRNFANTRVECFDKAPVYWLFGQGEVDGDAAQMALLIDRPGANSGQLPQRIFSGLPPY